MFLRLGLFFCVFLTTVSYTFASVDEEVPIILREPAANSKVLFPEARARVEVVADNKTVKAITDFNDWQIGEVVGIESQTRLILHHLSIRFQKVIIWALMLIGDFSL